MLRLLHVGGAVIALVPRLVGCASELGRLAFGNPFPFSAQTSLFSSPSCAVWGVGLCLNVLLKTRILDRR